MLNPGRKGLTAFIAANDWLPLFLIFLLAFCAWVLLLPLFPSQDGPNHVFDAYIFSRLLTHSPGIYSHYYSVRYFFPPYCFHYYLLIALMKIVSPILADKLVVCVCIASFSCGFRYLAVGVGESGGVVSLLVFGIVLNWPLAMGFENYCLAVSMDIWCLGLWVRFSGKRSYRRRSLFTLVSLFTAFTHPLALPVLIGFCSLDLALRFSASIRRRFSVSSGRSLLMDLLTLLCSATFITYVAMFLDNHAAGTGPHVPYAPTWNLRTYVAMYGLAFFGKHGVASIAYRFVLALILMTGLGIASQAFRQRVQGSLWGVHERFFMLTVAALVLLPFVPKTINDPYYLVVRLLLFVWVGALASAAGHKKLSMQTQYAIGLGACTVVVIILVIALHRINPLARRIAIVQKESLQPAGSVGLNLPAYEGADYTYPVIYALPYEWAASHYFRVSGAVMLNAPWMDSTYFPLGPTSALLTGKVNFAVLQQPVEFRKQLLQDGQLQQLVFPRISFIFFSDPAHIATDATLNDVLELDRHAHWGCHRNDWYILCTRQAARDIPGL